MDYHTYIVKCSDGTFYTGIAIDLNKRIAEHNGEGDLGSKYTRARRPVTLVYSTAFPDRSSAMKEEFRIKQLSRAGKEALVAGSE